MRFSTAFLIVAFLYASVSAAQENASEPEEGTEDVLEAGASDGGPGSEPACFRRWRYAGFVGGQHVYVEGLRNQHFLLTVCPGCPRFEHYEFVRVIRWRSRVCGNDGSRVEAWGTRLPSAMCRIIAVERLASREDAEEMAQHAARDE